MSALSYARNDWYPVADKAWLDAGGGSTRLLGERLEVWGSFDAPQVADANGRALPTQQKFGHIWTCLGEAPRPLFEVPEGDEQGRTLVPCGRVQVACSPLRAVENFLDIAHFPFVHTDVLGAEPHTQVEPYKVEIRESVDEVWAAKVKFFQPQAAKSAVGGITTEYEYRVPHPTTAILYKSCPPKPQAQDVIAIFVQPVDQVNCVVWPWMALYDWETPYADLVQFQQMIFLQDRSILENQRPKLLPLDPRMEIPTKADLTSVAYRRWLKAKGATYGATLDGGAR